MPVLMTIALAAALQASPQSAASSPLVAGASPPAAAKPKMECVDETTTGTMFAKRTCHTAEQWRQIREEQANTTSSALTAAAHYQAAGH